MVKNSDNNAHSANTTYKSHLEYITSNNLLSAEQAIDKRNDLNDETGIKRGSQNQDLLKQSCSSEDSSMQSLGSFLRECLAVTDTKEFFCGWGASVINIAITFPINKIIFRQMLHNVRVGGAFDQIRSEGFLFLYRGVLPPLMQKSISTSLMFGMYENCRKPMIAYSIPSIICNPSAAMLAGTIEAVLTPFERIQTLMQDSGYHKNFKNTTHAMKVVLAEHGFKEFYRGLVPILLRNGPSNVFFFGLRDYYNEKIPDSKLWYLKITKQFMIGACIGSLISSIFYPCNVVKVHVQSQLGGRFIGFIAAAKEVFVERNRSVRSFYRGIYMNCTRSFVSWGVINVSYEAIHKIVYE